MLKGNVIKGIGLAKTVGFPTLNVRTIEKYKCGVYRGYVKLSEDNENEYLSTFHVDDSDEYIEIHLDKWPENVKTPTTIEFFIENEIDTKNSKNGIYPMFYKACKNKKLKNSLLISSKIEIFLGLFFFICFFYGFCILMYKLFKVMKNIIFRRNVI